VKVAAKVVAAKIAKESSSSDSDDAKKIPSKAVVKTPIAAKPSKKSSSSSDTDSDAKKPIMTKSNGVVAKVSKKSSSSSSDSDEPVKKTPVKVATKVAKESSSSDSDAGAKENPKAVKKTPIAANPSTKSSSDSDAKNGVPTKARGKRTPNEPFRRIKTNIEDIPAHLRDNSYQADHDAWGASAHNSMSRVQGKGFRHEKTKKKRGSYVGGKINTSVNSIRYDDSD